MAIAWSCNCGMSFNTEPKSAGRKILCPSCGKMNVVPQVQVKAGPPPIAAVVTPIDDEEEDDIPEIRPMTRKT